MKIAGTIFVCIFVATCLAFVFANNQQLANEINASRIPTSDVELSDLTLDANPPIYELSGTVQNNSDIELTRVYLTVLAYDCPAAVITDDCKLIAKDSNVTITLTVPAYQTGHFDHTVQVHFGTLPPIKGAFEWSYVISGTGT